LKLLGTFASGRADLNRSAALHFAKHELSFSRTTFRTIPVRWPESNRMTPTTVSKPESRETHYRTRA